MVSYRVILSLLLYFYIYKLRMYISLQLIIT
jgi:hypothetical protein